MSRLRLLPACLLLAAVMLPTSIFARDTKEDSDAKKLNPKQTMATFYRHLEAGELSKAKRLLFTPIHNPWMASRVDELLESLAEQQEDGKVHVFDSHAIQDLAVVVCGVEGRRYTDNIDIDPFFLRKKVGVWRLVVVPAAPVVKQELQSDELSVIADQLIDWYDKREISVRVEWRDQRRSTE